MVVLEGPAVRLEPLTLEHAPALVRQLDEAVAAWTMPAVRDEASLRAWIEARLVTQTKGTLALFAVLDTATGVPIGATALYDLRPAHGSAKIGHTWFGPAYRRTGANREAKWLLLRHAFEDLGLHRVGFEVDARNAGSRAAVLALGAVQEGILRRHKVMPDGHVRDTVIFGITDLDWPEVAQRLAPIPS